MEKPALQCGDPALARMRNYAMYSLVAIFCLLGAGAVLLLGAIGDIASRCAQP